MKFESKLTPRLKKCKKKKKQLHHRTLPERKKSASITWRRLWKPLTATLGSHKSTCLLTIFFYKLDSLIGVSACCSSGSIDRGRGRGGKNMEFRYWSCKYYGETGDAISRLVTASMIIYYCYYVVFFVNATFGLM